MWKKLCELNENVIIVPVVEWNEIEITGPIVVPTLAE